MVVWDEPVRFEWDEGNKDKNWHKHHVTPAESEEVFFDPHKRFLPVSAQTNKEKRHLLIGRTHGKRTLFVVFTIRKGAVRIISVRDLNTKERNLYEKVP